MKSGQKPPKGIDIHSGDRCASFDGDADRIVYFFQDSGNHGYIVAMVILVD